MGFWGDVGKGVTSGAAKGGLGWGILTGGLGALPGAVVGGIAGGIHAGVTSGSGEKPAAQQKSQVDLAGLARHAPLTAEVQKREQMQAALEALIPAAQRDAERSNQLLLAAETGGKRQAAEQLLQETRGFETGTGAASGLGRRRAAEVLMGQQQIAAQRADETPAFDIANLKATVLGQIQSLGGTMMDRASKLASYPMIIDAYPDDQRGLIIDVLLELESGPGGDPFVVQALNSLKSEPNPAYGSATAVA